MKFQVTDRVAIFQTDAILGMSDDQASHRAHQLQPLGKGRYRVTGPNVKFQRGETVEIIGGPAAPAALKDDALALGLRFGLGVGEGTLKARIDAEMSARAESEKAATAAVNQSMAEKKKARAKAAKARG